MCQQTCLAAACAQQIRSAYFQAVLFGGALGVTDGEYEPKPVLGEVGAAQGQGQGWDVPAGGETRGCLCMPAPSQEWEGWGAGEELGPTLFRAMTWAGTGFQTYKPQSAQSLY